MAKKKVSKKKKEVTEIYEVEKKGEEKIVKSTGKEEVLVEKPDQRKQNNRTLKIFLIIVGAILLLLVAGYFYVDSLRYSTYDGVPFVTVKEGEMILYKTTAPNLPDPRATNFYFRTKISKLKRIPFDREGFKLMKIAAINGTDSFDCFEGDEVIAEVTLQKAHEVLGMEFMKDPTAGCDKEGRYSYYNFIESDKTKIERVGENCYDIHVANCEIMAAAEKVIAEIFLDYNQNFEQK